MPFEIWSALIAARSASLAVLSLRGLIPSHWYLAAYLAAEVLLLYVVRDVPTNSPRYMIVWGVTLPILTALQVGMGLAAYNRSLELFPQARTTSHRMILGLCLVAAILVQPFQTTFTLYGAFSRMEQGTTLAMGLFSLLMIPLLNRYYSPRRRPNARRQEWILALHFLGNSLGLLATHSGALMLGHNVIAGVSFATSLAWATMLTRTGEVMPPRPAMAEAVAGAQQKKAAEIQFAGIMAGLRDLSEPK